MNSNFLIPVYKKVGPFFKKGKGSFLWDEHNTRYLDLFPGWGVSILGHCHPRIVKIIGQQSQRLIHIPNNLQHRWQGRLAQEIVKNSFKAKVFFANSGTEAIEGAIKFSRLYGKRRRRHEIVVMRNSFHGRTMGSLSATGQSKYKLLFKPLLPTFKEARFNDFKSARSRINKKTVGVLLELIQGEGGVHVARDDYVQQLWRFCKRHDLLFMVDEVQTGMGRTSKLFCYQHYNIKPDVMVLSKGIGAGFPLSCIVVKKDIADIMGAGLHASTFGGNPLATRVGLEVFKIIKEQKILTHVRDMGRYFVSQLMRLQDKYSSIKEIRGKGLMIGVELTQDAAPVFNAALREKLILNATQGNVLRIMPALNVTKREIDLGISILDKVFRRL